MGPFDTSTPPSTKRGMFTVEERDRARARIIELGRTDARIVAGAEVGSMSQGGGDRWSDLDLTFGVAAGTPLSDVLADWTRTIVAEFHAVHLFDLPYMTSVYRVFLFPGSLQVDVSFTPAAQFGALGPKFKLLFGDAVQREHPTLPSPGYVFGVGVHHLVRARISMERGRLWESAYLIAAARDQALGVACLAHGLDPRYGRGYDALPREMLARAEESLVRSIDRAELMRALQVAIELLLVSATGELRDVASRLEAPMSELTRDPLG